VTGGAHVGDRAGETASVSPAPRNTAQKNKANGFMAAAPECTDINLNGRDSVHELLRGTQRRRPQYPLSAPNRLQPPPRNAFVRSAVYSTLQDARKKRMS